MLPEPKTAIESEVMVSLLRGVVPISTISSFSWFFAYVGIKTRPPIQKNSFRFMSNAESIPAVWDSGEPNNVGRSHEICAALRASHGGRVHNLVCSNKCPLICQYPNSDQNIIDKPEQLVWGAKWVHTWEGGQELCATISQIIGDDDVGFLALIPDQQTNSDIISLRSGIGPLPNWRLESWIGANDKTVDKRWDWQIAVKAGDNDTIVTRQLPFFSQTSKKCSTNYFCSWSGGGKEPNGGPGATAAQYCRSGAWDDTSASFANKLPVCSFPKRVVNVGSRAFIFTDKERSLSDHVPNCANMTLNGVRGKFAMPATQEEEDVMWRMSILWGRTTTMVHISSQFAGWSETNNWWLPGYSHCNQTSSTNSSNHGSSSNNWGWWRPAAAQVRRCRSARQGQGPLRNQAKSKDAVEAEQRAQRWSCWTHIENPKQLVCRELRKFERLQRW